MENIIYSPGRMMTVKMKVNFSQQIKKLQEITTISTWNIEFFLSKTMNYEDRRFVSIFLLFNVGMHQT